MQRLWIAVLCSIVASCCLQFFDEHSFAQEQSPRQASWQTIDNSAARDAERVQIRPIHSEPAASISYDSLQARTNASPSTSLNNSSVVPASFPHTNQPSLQPQRLAPQPNLPKRSLSVNTTNEPPKVENRDASKLTKLPTPKQAPNPVAAGSSTGFKTLVTTVSALAVVLALFIGLVVIGRKGWQPKRGSLPKQVFEVLGKTAYAPRQQILVVRFGHKILLINHELGNVQTLSEIDQPEEVDRIVGLCEQQSGNSISANFSNVLSQVMTGTVERPVVKKSLFSRSSAQVVVRKAV